MLFEFYRVNWSDMFNDRFRVREFQREKIKYVEELRADKHREKLLEMMFSHKMGSNPIRTF